MVSRKKVLNDFGDFSSRTFACLAILVLISVIARLFARYQQSRRLNTHFLLEAE